MAKPPKTGAGDLPPINDDELAAAQARLQARIDQSEAKAKAKASAKGDKAAKPEGKDSAKPKAAAKPARRAPSPVHKPRPTKETPPKRAAGFGTVLLCSVMAASIGGAIGWLGPQYFAKDGGRENVAQSVQTLERITALETGVSAQGETLAAMKADVQTAMSRMSALDDLQDQMRIIAGSVDERLAGLDEAARERSVILERLDLTEAMLAETGAAPPTQILERIDGLDTRMTQITESLEVQGEVQAQMPVAPVYAEGADPDILLERLNAAEARIAELEAKPERVETAEPAAATPTSLASNYDFAGNFPREAMLAAVEKDSRRGAEKGWLQRQLDRHMQSGADSAEQARREITRAADLTRRGDIKGAARIIKSQSPTVQDAARAWLAAADMLD